MMRETLLLLAAACLVACLDRTLPPEGQVVLYVATDAPLPHDNAAQRPFEEPPPLFDTLRVDVLEACDADCTRDFPLSREIVDAGASVGILPDPAALPLVRLRLFRASVVDGDGPRRESTIDMTVSLPAVGEEGIT